ncbi:protein CTR9 homolog isoform X5 [Asparagus officinalis]|uniref:protein CTR9 homolog isoform X5 n=1 Tax=Asparagus officinalis TaxID=4686 RepID=UPI00098DE22D|nr:protein CTR9 homolog isoform X5 [Asparagus officinalis]
MDLEASDDEVQMWSSPIRIPQVLKLHPENLYAINGTGAILAEKCHFNVSNDIFSEVQEAASGSIFVRMSDVWYQNCLQKFYYNTDTEVFLYLSFTHY